MSSVSGPKAGRRRKEPRPDPAQGMSLVDHLRELRNRLVKSGIAITVGMIVGWIYYDVIFAWLTAPFNAIVAQAQAQGHTVILALNGVTDPFTLQLQISAMVGIVLSAPVWLYQLWRFVAAGLHTHERRWALAFAFVAAPLFFLGVYLAYRVIPSGLALLFGFTPQGVENIVSVDRYLDFFVRTILVFGVGFLLPLLLVLLNFAGLLSGKQLLSWWRAIVLIVCVFAAVATPTGDPWNMMLLALPIMGLVMIAIGVCLLNDKRRDRRRKTEGLGQWDDDEASSLDTTPSEIESAPTDIDAPEPPTSA
ncbi:MAG: twin-arginine translocase subunit TatC [Actinobacteria bacterium]|nr:twin-arginine translocase subunit TatC [Actinomycetota bacterium]